MHFADTIFLYTATRSSSFPSSTSRGRRRAARFALPSRPPTCLILLRREGCNTKRACVLGFTILFTIFIFQCLRCGLRVLFVCRGWAIRNRRCPQSNAIHMWSMPWTIAAWGGGVCGSGTAAKRAERSAARDIPLLCNNFIAYSTNESAKQDAIVLSPTLWISKFRNLEFWTAGCDGFSSTHSHSPAAPDLVTASEAKCSAHLP
jgi:hypothetical protein